MTNEQEKYKDILNTEISNRQARRQKIEIDLMLLDAEIKTLFLAKEKLDKAFAPSIPTPKSGV